jgi:Zn-dependent protease/tetratricopeptide (TPR) repeat protein
MNDIFSNEALAGILLVIAILQYRRIGGFFNLSKIRLRPSVWLTVPRSEVPAHTLKLLDCSAAGLQGLGFEPICTQAAEPFNVFDPRAKVYADLYWHPDLAVLAKAELAETVSGQVIKVQFVTLVADAKALITVNRERWAQLPVPLDIAVEDAYADDLAGQWQAHQDAVAREAGQRGVVTDQAEAFLREAALGMPHWIDRLLALGWAKEESPAYYRFTTKGAWSLSSQMAGMPKSARKALARPYRHDPPPDFQTARLAEMDSVAAILALSNQPLPAWIRAGLFVLTLAFSAILFGRGFGLVEAAALLTVLLVHELGHLAAMRAFDYQNLSIFFLPFVGAAATGHKPHAPPWQEAIVLLAGPVPGLVLAFAATQISSDALSIDAISFVRSWVWFSLFLNLFNLLPFGMLDGGRLFELAVLMRFPYARAVFTTLGLVLGLGFAVWSQSITLGLLMLLMMCAVPLQFKAAKVISSIRAKDAGMKALNGEQAIAALGMEFASADYGGVGPKGWMQRVNIARLAYPRLLQGVPGLGMSLAVLGSLLVSLFAPLILVAWAWSQPGQMPLMRSNQAEQQEYAKQNEARPERARAKQAQEAFLARYAAEPDAAAKWAMLDKHEEEDQEEFAYAFTEAHLAWLREQRARLLEQLPEDHIGKILHRLNQAKPGTPEAPAILLAVIDQLDGGTGSKAATLDEDRFGILIQAYRRLVNEAQPQSLEARKPALDALWASLETPDHPLAEQKPALAALRAHMAFAAGQFSEAETWMDRYQAASAPQDQQAGLTHAWFLLDIGRFEQALALAKPAIESSQTDKSSGMITPSWQTVAGWAEMGLGHPQQADAYFQAVLENRAQRMSASRDSLPWWLRWLTWGADQKFKQQRRIDPQTLDHLTALDAYDPTQAAQLRAEWANPEALATQRILASNSFSTADGWGKVRAAAHEKVLKTLELQAKDSAARLKGTSKN